MVKWVYSLLALQLFWLLMLNKFDQFLLSIKSINKFYHVLQKCCKKGTNCSISILQKRVYRILLSTLAVAEKLMNETKILYMVRLQGKAPIAKFHTVTKFSFLLVWPCLIEFLFLCP